MRSLCIATTALMLATSPMVASAQLTSQEAATATDIDEFSGEAAQSSLTEVLMSTLALQKTSDVRVENHAWTMLDHHSRAMGELAEALNDDAALLPAEPNTDQAAILDEMRDLDGTAFDEAYFAHQLEAHERAISIFERGEQVSDDQVAQYARTTLPVLRAHLEITRIRHEQPPERVSGQ